jgi:protein-tyrosine phosphatase
MDGKSRAEAMRQFGFRTDLDIRTQRECYGMTGSPLGPDVKWVNIPSPAYGRMHEDYGHDAFAKCFRIFLDESNYPVDFHCIQGADRTGCLAYILGALPGVSDRELECDWEVTVFTNPNPHFAHAERYDKFVAEFGKYPGNTSRERVEAYVKARGFTDADIAKFRSIMLEK